MRGMTTLILVTVSLWGSIVYGRSWQPPADSARCPSKWGSGDQRGAGNHMNAPTVLRAARLIRPGEVFELGRVLADSMPLSAGRRFEVLTKRAGRIPGLAASQVYEFALIVEPLKIQGGTGSTVAPIAIH